MPLFTPSRIAVIVVSFSLLSFLWTWGLPNQLASSSLPIISHDAPQGKPLVEPLIPGPAIAGDSETTATGPAETGTPGSGGKEIQNGQERPKESVKPEGNIDGTTPTTLLTEAVSLPSETPIHTGAPRFCREVLGAPHVMVILRTSKAEMSDKLPDHVKTLLDCVPNFAIFSDHAGQIDGFPVHDALDTISNKTMLAHDEFREYEKIKTDKGHKASVEETKKLDKWKYLPMVYKAYRMKPHQRFYLLIEADTSLSWHNLLQWLNRLDYRIPYYTGAPMFQGDTKYAQRGPGILLSYGALRQYAKKYDEQYTDEWESHVGKECCGDIMLANAMKNSQVEFASSFPLLQGEAPSSLDWTDRHWCAPIISWHHMSKAEITQLWDSQHNWTQIFGWTEPYLIRHAFDEFILPNLEEKKVDWDNISSDTHIKAEPGRKEKLAKEKAGGDEKEKPDTKEKTEDKPKDSPKEPAMPKPPNPAKPPRAVPIHALRSKREEEKEKPVDWDKIAATVKDAADSATHCQTVCEKTDDCLQWKWTPKGDGECHLGKVIRLGRSVGPDKDGDRWTSGWMVDRIKKVTTGWGECEKPNWRFNQ